MEKLIFYSLSTCIWCRKTRQHLDDLGIEYDLVLVDQLTGDERSGTMDKLARVNPKKSFPTLVFGENLVVVGFKPDEISAALEKRNPS